MTTPLETLIDERTIIVCTGTGGVGKTTIAATIAIEGARRGRRTVVVTIDPAKRLADALGLDSLSDEPSVIPGPWPGELSATMLDTKSTFDALIAANAPSPEQAESILNNRFYRNVSSAMSGTQEYMAMEKLHALHESGDYDLIVVDTPPTRNALDFLDSPNRLTNFLNHRLYRILMAPTRGIVKVVSSAAQSLLRSIAKVVGAEVIDEVIDFFQAFEGMEEGFASRANEVLELLAADVTAFVLVTSPRADTAKEARYFATALSDAGIAVEALIVNRMHPGFSAADPAWLRSLATSHPNSALADHATCLAEYTELSQQEATRLSPLLDDVKQAPTSHVPELATDVHGMDTIEILAGHLFSR